MPFGSTSITGFPSTLKLDVIGRPRHASDFSPGFVNFVGEM